MSERDEVHLDIDPMLFYAAVIEEQVTLVDSFDTAVGMFDGMPGMSTLAAGVTDIGREKIAEAQAQLDRLIAEDETWEPAYGTECAMVYDGNDPEDGDYFRCTTHGYLVLGDAYVCEGYAPPPYVERSTLVWFDQDPDYDPVDYDRDGFHSPGEAEHFEDDFLAAFDRALGPDLPFSVEHGGLRFVYDGDGDPKVYRPLVQAAWAKAEREVRS